MSRYKVTPEGVRMAKENMIAMTGKINTAFVGMMDSMEHLENVFVNSKTRDVLEIMNIRKLDFLSAQANLVRTIGNLEDIAAEYEAAERDNINELHSVN